MQAKEIRSFYKSLSTDVKKEIDLRLAYIDKEEVVSNGIVYSFNLIDARIGVYIEYCLGIDSKDMNCLLLANEAYQFGTIEEYINYRKLNLLVAMA
jgi:hypothetical protein